eukprot:6431326-Pyramimonas_sp.AAC.1
MTPMAPRYRQGSVQESCALIGPRLRCVEANGQIRGLVATTPPLPRRPPKLPQRLCPNQGFLQRPRKR